MIDVKVVPIAFTSVSKAPLKPGALCSVVSSKGPRTVPAMVMLDLPMPIVSLTA